MNLDQIALQLYTIHAHVQTPADIRRSLKRVREIGYRTVQASGLGPIAEEELNEIVAGEGLRICATPRTGGNHPRTARKSRRAAPPVELPLHRLRLSGERRLDEAGTGPKAWSPISTAPAPSCARPVRC